MPQTADQNATLEVEGTLVTITSSPTLPAADIGVPYVFNFTADGGTPPYSWVGIGGAFPPGITLDSDGTLHGTPQALGPFAFTVRVTDSGG